MGQQPDARLAEVAHALRYAGQKRQQRTFERIRANVGNVKAPVQGLGQRAARLELQTAVLEREFDHLGDLGHRTVHRCHPG